MKDKIGFLAGCFDPFPHPGVLRAMEEAVDACDLAGIFIGLHVNPQSERPEKAPVVMTVEERTIMLKAIRWVVDVESYKTEVDLLALLCRVKPDVRILGSDYKWSRGTGGNFTGSRLATPVFYARRYEGWSGTLMRERMKPS